MIKASKIAIAVLSLCAAGAAQAMDIRFEDTAGLKLWTSQSQDYLSGGMQFSQLGGTSFEAFCIELAQGHASTASGFQSYQVGSFSGQQATLLQGLFSSAYAGLSTAGQKAAFQVAIWEITHEQSGSLDAAAGSFELWGLSDGDASAQAAFMSQANSYLQSAASYAGPALYTISKLSHDNYQDLVAVSAVPEPESYALMLAGLGLMGFVARRRQRA